MPGSITQTKGGTANGRIATFEIEDLTQENDLAVYADTNNVWVIVGIIAALSAVLGIGFVVLKRKDNP